MRDMPPLCTAIVPSYALACEEGRTSHTRLLPSPLPPVALAPPLSHPRSPLLSVLPFLLSSPLRSPIPSTPCLLLLAPATCAAGTPRSRGWRGKHSTTASFHALPFSRPVQPAPPTVSLWSVVCGALDAAVKTDIVVTSSPCLASRNIAHCLA